MARMICENERTTGRQRENMEEYLASCRQETMSSLRVTHVEDDVDDICDAMRRNERR